MFIRKAVKSLGAVYKAFSHGAVREGSTVGPFIAGFLPWSYYYTEMHYSTSACLSVGAHMLRHSLGIN